MKEKAKCMIRYCRGDHYCRGLCSHHYGATRANVQSGETTWEDEVKLGCARAPLHGNAWTGKKLKPPTPEIRAHVEKVSKAVHSHKTCMVPGCTEEAATRGLCRNDYAVANTLVKKGLTTWKKLVSAGRAEDARKGGFRVNRAKDFFLSK